MMPMAIQSISNMKNSGKKKHYTQIKPQNDTNGLFLSLSIGYNVIWYSVLFCHLKFSFVLIIKKKSMQLHVMSCILRVCVCDNKAYLEIERKGILTTTHPQFVWEWVEKKDRCLSLNVSN